MQDNNTLINKCFQKYLLPSIFAILGGNISIMIDNIIAGKAIGNDALAAMSMINPVFFVFTTLGMLICAGASSLASVCIGKNDSETKNKLFTLAILLSVVLGGITSAFSTAFLAPLVKALGADGNLYTMVYNYCRIFCPGGLFSVLIYLPLNFFRIEGRASLGMAMFIIMAALDIVFDLLFVLTWKMGIAGLALATVLSSMTAVAVVFPALFIKNAGYRIVSIRNSLQLIKDIIVTGSPLALNNFYSVVRLFFFNMIILTTGGPVAVACFSFANSINILAQAVVTGISQTVSPLVGVFFGERDVVSVKKVMKLAVRFGVLSMTVYIILTLLLAKPVCLLFGLSSPKQLQIAMPAVIICSLSLIGAMLNSIFVYYYMTVARTGIANRITLLRGLVFAVPFALLLAKIFGIVGIWVSFTVSECMTFLVLLLTVRCIRKKNIDLKGILLLDKHIYENNKSISFSVDNNTESIVESSTQINEFCKRCELTPKQSMLISLSIEEILLLMTEHIFKKGKKQSVDVRIYVDTDVIIMRFRSAGKKFNPIDYYKKELKNADEINLGGSLGLQMILKAVKKVDYTTNLGLNNMIITI